MRRGHGVGKELNSGLRSLRLAFHDAKSLGERLRSLLGALDTLGVHSVDGQSSSESDTHAAHEDARALNEGAGALRADTDGLQRASCGLAEFYSFNQPRCAKRDCAHARRHKGHSILGRARHGVVAIHHLGGALDQRAHHIIGAGGGGDESLLHRAGELLPIAREIVGLARRLLSCVAGLAYGLLHVAERSRPVLGRRRRLVEQRDRSVERGHIENLGEQAVPVFARKTVELAT